MTSLTRLLEMSTPLFLTSRLTMLPCTFQETPATCFSQIDQNATLKTKTIHHLQLKTEHTIQRQIMIATTTTTLINLISRITHCRGTSKNQSPKTSLSRLLISLLILMELTVTTSALHLQICRNKQIKKTIWRSALLVARLTAAKRSLRLQNSTKRSNP